MKHMRKVLGLLTVIGGLSLFVVMQMVVYMSAPVAMALSEMGTTPGIAVDPGVLDSVQPSDTIVTQTVTIYNLGDSDLDWHVYDGVVGLWDQADNATNSGPPSQYFPDLNQGGYAADDFVVPSGETWQIDEVFVAGGYSAGSGPAPDFDVTVYDEASGVPDAVVASDTAVMPTSDINGDILIALDPPIVLTEGTYWLSVNANMDFVGPPEQWGWIEQPTQTGSPYHWTETGMFATSCIGVWQPGASVCNVGSGIDPDLAFRLAGDYPDIDCDPISALPWVTVNPISGTVAVSSTLPVDVAFDATGYVFGVYTGTLCIASNDPIQPLLPVPLTMTVVAPAFGVEVGPDDSTSNLPGSQAHYSVAVMNVGNTADVYTITVSSTWTTTLSASSVALAGGASSSVEVTVTIPIDGIEGEMDTAVIIAISQTDMGISDSATLTTTVGSPPLDELIYLPFVRK